MLKKVQNFKMKPKNITLVIEGGKKRSLRAGDILGALTGEDGLDANAIGKIDIYDKQSFVAIEASKIDSAYERIKTTRSKLKNSQFGSFNFMGFTHKILIYIIKFINYLAIYFVF